MNIESEMDCLRVKVTEAAPADAAEGTTICVRFGRRSLPYLGLRLRRTTRPLRVREANNQCAGRLHHVGGEGLACNTIDYTGQPWSTLVAPKFYENERDTRACHFSPSTICNTFDYTPKG